MGDDHIEANIIFGTPPPRLRPLRPGETGADLARSVGLERCPDCGEFRGTCLDEDGDEARLLCICQGVPCQRCKQRPIRRPISEHFVEETGSVSHTAHFAWMIPCARCKQELANR